MKKVRIMQQALNPVGYGGVSVEFRALKETKLTNKYEFVPLILENSHRGISLKDIYYYYKKIKEVKPDIVQIRGANVDGLNAVIAVKLVHNVKSMYCIHGLVSDNIYYNSLKKWIFKNIVEKLGFYLADGISCVYKKCELRDIFTKYQSKLLPHIYNRMPNYSNIDKTKERKEFRKKYGIPEMATMGVFCGRISREKGLDFLIEALNGMRKKWPGLFYICIVGDGDYLENVKLQVNDEIKKYILFTGATMNVIPALAAADFFVFPSLHENHSIALLEALAMGLPCIATDVGGNGETVIKNELGFLIPPFDSEALEVALYKMCDNKIRIQFIKMIEEYNFSQFSNEAIDEQLDIAYQMLLKNSF